VEFQSYWNIMVWRTLQYPNIGARFGHFLQEGDRI
jgi:hypothetical protein